MQKTFFTVFSLAASLSVISLSGCAARMARNDQEAAQEQQAAGKPGSETPAAFSGEGVAPAVPPAAEAPGAATNPRATALGMSARLDALEAKLSAINDKLDSTRTALDSFLAAHQPKTTSAPQMAADTVGMAVSSPTVATDSETGFVNDASIQQYRKAEILLESQKYADAILVFSNFLEHYPDHALAGSAQFHVGEAHFKQKNWRVADQEFQKVLTSYDRSIHVSDTLRLMALAEDHLGKTQEAARHRQQLSSLFANSPSAAQLGNAPPAVVVEPTSQDQPAGAAASAPESTEEEKSAPAIVSPGTKPGLDGPPPTAPVTPEKSMEKSGEKPGAADTQ